MSGVITLNTVNTINGTSAGFLDYEVTQMYALNVSAQDMGEPNNTAIVQVFILITVSSV